MLITWKITAYAYLVKAKRMVLDADVPEVYREEVVKRLITE